jgi:hypothetical protein
VAGADRPEAAPVLWVRGCCPYGAALVREGRHAPRRRLGCSAGMIAELRRSDGWPVVAEGAVVRHSVTGAGAG